MNIKCKCCSYIKQEGKQNSNIDTFGRKHYWCTHPDIETIDLKKFGNRSRGFVCFGENTYKSEITIKTSPRWCPLKIKKKVKNSEVEQ